MSVTASAYPVEKKTGFATAIHHLTLGVFFTRIVNNYRSSRHALFFKKWRKYINVDITPVMTTDMGGVH